MKPNIRRLFALLTCLLLLFALLFPAAAASPIDLEQEASMTIRLLYNDVEPIPNATFDVYRLACVDELAEYALEPLFASYPITLKNNTIESWNDLAYTLRGYVEADSLAPTYVLTTDENGSVYQGQLEPGLYLVLGRKLVSGNATYTVTPAIVALPGMSVDSGEWNYDVTVLPKCDREEIPDEKTVSRKVLKVWDDGGVTENRPKTINISLLRDGVLYEKVTLDETSNWRFEWPQLPATDADGGVIEWSVVEDAVMNYTTKVELTGTTFVVTNTSPGVKPPVKPDPELPKTGLLWWPVPMLLCIGILFLIIGISRRRRYES